MLKLQENKKQSHLCERKQRKKKSIKGQAGEIKESKVLS